VEALRKGKKKDKGETQEPSKLTVFFWVSPSIEC
jgi:hypothetical protein